VSELDEKAQQTAAEAELAALAPWAQQMVHEAMAVYPEVPLIEMIDILEYFTGIGSAPARARSQGST
jgi:hypothetical protein